MYGEPLDTGRPEHAGGGFEDVGSYGAGWDGEPGRVDDPPVDDVVGEVAVLELGVRIRNIGSP
jgi:hypothetical protein